MTARPAAVALAAAVALPVTGCASPPGSEPLPPVPSASVGEWGVARDGLDAEARTTDVVEVPFPGGVVRVATSGPHEELVPGTGLDRRPRPVPDGAEVRDVAWHVEPVWSLEQVLGVSRRVRLAVLAGSATVPLPGPFGGVDRLGRGAAAIVVPAGEPLRLEVTFDGGDLQVPLDGPDRGAPGPAAGLRDGLVVREGGCRVLDVVVTTEPGPPPAVGPRLEAGVVDSPWWPGLGFAGAGRTWRAVRVSGALDRIDPADVVDTASLALAGGRRVTETAEDTPFGRSGSGASAVFDVPAGGRTADLTVTSADGDVVVTCRPVAVTPPPR